MTHELSLATPGRPTMAYILRYPAGQEIAALEAVGDSADEGDLTAHEAENLAFEIGRRMAKPLKAKVLDGS